MDLLVDISAAFYLFAVVVSVVLKPFDIGKPREPYTASAYMATLATSVMVIIMIGRIWGWW
jgi:hypothetical protein